MSVPSPIMQRYIDTDVHHAPDFAEIVRRQPAGYRKRGAAGGGSTGLQNPQGVNRVDAVTPDGKTAGSDPDYMLEHHFEPLGIDYGILHPGNTLGVGIAQDYRHAAVTATAYNDYMLETWLEHDKRFLGALLVTPNNPTAAAKEIRRVGGSDRFVQTIMCSASRVPLGQELYWPMYEAAEEMGLPVAVHPGTEGRGISGPPTPAGWPTSYIEWHTVLSQNYMAQITSLVLEGVFQKFPKLTFVAVEGGIAWLPHLMWRLDKNWKGLRELVPWLEEPPSAVIRRHVKLTSQPVEEPEKPEHLLQILDMIDAHQTLMFSSDYPHWDGDDPRYAFPRKLDEDLKQRIFYDTAAELYGLPKRVATPATEKVAA